MSNTLQIDIVSDVVCPWCIIGYKRLEKALEQLSGQIEPEIHWHPFELNPQMLEGGENLRQHAARKYGTTLEGSIAARKRLTDIGASLGFTFNYYDQMRIYNTFKAHQLLHWAEEYGKEMALQMELFSAYFSQQQAVDRAEVLVEAASCVGLDRDLARNILDDQRYADTVKQREAEWIARAIRAVPAFIFDRQYLVSGAQEVKVFVELINQRISSGNTEEENPVLATATDSVRS